MFEEEVRGDVGFGPYCDGPLILIEVEYLLDG